MSRLRLTVQGWLNLVLSVIGVVVLAGAVAVAVLLDNIDRKSAELAEVIQPTRVNAQQLQNGLRDQETAVRGYVIAADRQFLEPYAAGQQAEAEAAEKIRRRVGERPQQMSDLQAIETAAARWRADYAEPLIASVVPGRPAAVDAAPQANATRNP